MQVQANILVQSGPQSRDRWSSRNMYFTIPHFQRSVDRSHDLICHLGDKKGLPTILLQCTSISILRRNNHLIKAAKPSSQTCFHFWCFIGIFSFEGSSSAWVCDTIPGSRSHSFLSHPPHQTVSWRSPSCSPPEQSHSLSQLPIIHILHWSLVS